jgi:hypothetical protein
MKNQIMVLASDGDHEAVTGTEARATDIEEAVEDSEENKSLMI